MEVRFLQKAAKETKKGRCFRPIFVELREGRARAWWIGSLAILLLCLVCVLCGHLRAQETEPEPVYGVFSIVISLTTGEMHSYFNGVETDIFVNFDSNAGR